MSFKLQFLSLLFSFGLTVSACFAGTCPKGFVDLKKIDSSIKIDSVAVAQPNFIGRHTKGYGNTNKIIVSKKLGLALKEVQNDLRKKGLSLLVYDAYRPQMAVDDFIEWGKDLSDQKTKEWFYPYVDKAEIFKEGYVARRSSHSRGGAVDLTLIPINQNVHPIIFSKRSLESGKVIPFLDDGSIDMGSSAGLFDPVSWIDDSSISLTAQKNRQLLKEIMEKHGFKNYLKEWWHYSLINEPFSHTYFNFPIL